MVMPNRRGFLAGFMAASLIPRPTWADVGAPAYLSAGALADGSYVLCGITGRLEVLFQIPLPDRGHAAAAHPKRPEAVAFARRPGTFAVVIDCATGKPTAWMEAPQGRHFYGHGTFSADGRLLYTTENDFDAGEGRIGVWDATAGYRRVGEFASGGIGPHDIKRLPERDTLVVANGGIDTHPDTGRSKLNLPTMRPNLSYIEAGTIIDAVELNPDAHQNSIRHLAVGRKGEVALGMQWQGEAAPSSLVGIHSMGQTPQLLDCPPDDLRKMQGYIGSIALSDDGASIAVTSPRGGLVHIYGAASGTLAAVHAAADVSGVAAHPDGFAVTTGTGDLLTIGETGISRRASGPIIWDNHLVAI